MFKPNRLTLIDKDTIEKIHHETARVLEEGGVNFENEEALKLLKQAGAIVDGKNVRIPTNLLEKTISQTPKSFTMSGMDATKEFCIGEGQTRPRTDPTFGPTFIHEEGVGNQQPTMKHLVECYKLHEASPCCDVAGGLPIDPVDVSSDGRNLILLHEMLRHLSKPLRIFNTTRKEFAEMCSMFELAKGEKNYLNSHKCLFLTINPLSPLSYDKLPAESMIVFAEKHQVVCLQSCALTGFTSPMSLLGSTVLQNAEVLAGNVLLQTVNPGTPFLFGVTSSRADMRTGAYVCASPEADLMNIASVQVVSEYYKLPTRMMCGITDAKFADAQAGLETMQTMMTAALAGVNVLHGFGSTDGMNGASHAKYIMSQEIFSRVSCLLNGISQSNRDLSADEILSTGPGGTYMMNDATLANCQDTWSPTVSTQLPVSIWEEKGGTSLAQRAHSLALEIIQAAPDMLISVETDKKLTEFIQQCGYGK